MDHGGECFASQSSFEAFITFLFSFFQAFITFSTSTSEQDLEDGGEAEEEAVSGSG